MTLFIYARLFNIVKNQQQQQRWEYSRLKCIAIRELLPKYSPLLLSNKRNICLKNDGLQHRIIHDGIFFSLKSTLCLKWIVIFFETPGNMFCDHEKVSTFYTKRFFRVIYTIAKNKRIKQLCYHEMNLHNTKGRCVGWFQEVCLLWKSRLQSRCNLTYLIWFLYASKEIYIF